ncbi:MAG: type II toxin-antitoxin system HicB family antitoxin [Candidatus Eremiobacteraeota bacterium]|nr:type II toxin-antitoxin system HicB family antitoxin [Candidatus Eremiobacteraeota bacterium]
MKYAAIVHKEKDGIFLEFPDLPGCMTDGNSIEELKKFGMEALSGYLKSLIEDDEDIPESSLSSGENILWFEIPPELIIAIQILKERKRQGLTQMGLAERMKGSRRTVQEVEGLKGSPTLRTLKKIAKALGKQLVVKLI